MGSYSGCCLFKDLKTNYNTVRFSKLSFEPFCGAELEKKEQKKEEWTTLLSCSSDNSLEKQNLLKRNDFFSSWPCCKHQRERLSLVNTSFLTVTTGLSLQQAQRSPPSAHYRGRNRTLLR